MAKTQVTENIVNRLKQITKRPVTIGVCGRAGAGKSTLTEKVTAELKTQSIPSVSYSGDWRFKLDSEQRKQWIGQKWLSGMDEYLRAVNQFNWWDFGKIYADLETLSNGNPVSIKGAYNRANGKKDLDVNLPGIKDGVIFYENCILGGVEILEKLDIIIMVNVPDAVSLERVIKKDSDRRNLSEIVARYLITTYSENLFFNLLIDKFSHKLIVCDSEGKLGGFPEIQEVSQIPVPMADVRPVDKNVRKGTIFIDLDGTLIKHVPVPSETGEDIEILEGTPEKLKEFRDKSYYLILTTSRPHHKIFGIINKLKSEGIEFDQILCDLPVGPRHIINDMKGSEVRTIAHVLKRDEGIKKIKID